MAKKIIEQDFTHWVQPVKLNNDWPDKYNLQCITTIEQLTNVLLSYQNSDGTYPLMGFDTETSGLNPEDDSIVGFSFGFNEVDAYYVPTAHLSLGLGDKALDIIYDVMCKCELVLIFNARFDIRMMEWNHFENESNDFKRDFIVRARQLYSKYDMSKVKIYDVQVMLWAMDSAHYYPSLKWAELQLLGWRSNTFEETQGGASNFAYLDPTDPKVYKYGATDALALVLIYNKSKWIRDEAKLSLQMHASGKVISLCRFEQTPILADVDLLRKQSEYYHGQLGEIEKRIYTIVGYTFNISSGPARAKAFRDKNIIITETTSSGKVATGAPVIDEAKKQFDKNSDQYILLDLCSEYLHIKKMLSTYIDSLLEQVTTNSFRDGYFRYNYRNVGTSSGRYAGGRSE
jgi:DNA polymerase-1